MESLEGWAPYLNNPLALSGFISLVGALVLLGVLRYAGVGNKVIATVSAVYAACIIVALSLAVTREVRMPTAPPATASTPTPTPTPEKSQIEKVKPETPASINIQIARGSNNVITNGAGKDN